MRISLIATHHAERGVVTASALLALLARLRPEVVFAEIPQTHVDAWKDGSHGTVESIAVVRYAAAAEIDVVPVDLPAPDASFFARWQELTRAIERTSAVYRNLVDMNAERMREGGFPYLNSDASMQAWTDIYREELDTVEYIGKASLRAIYDEVRSVIEQRELAMLANIREYCASATKVRGVFLVGAAHRKSLVEKLGDDDDNGTPHLEWDVSGSQLGFG